ncbi:endolysin [Bacillus phage Shbh1]|uniref:N-acetylmuramoyl-L-alanine amidase-like protein n=1 Tax=Bacillus phage Shbh1 TaxID=1796992 RepID=A0A142F1B8_9CAUD|nr:endolysin [Bacillus phage Shbh1]AMQ66575.1 N-acetylmuramoyl-L-alanine amidase-like protein [Bacillus phage Shbh1]
MTKIFIDPGHGGRDPGAVGNGLKEKDLTLDISRKLDTYLRNNYQGVQTRLSRTNDTFVSLTARADAANNWGADIFVSIHVNAGGGTGFETLINGTLSLNSTTGRIAKEFNDEVVNQLLQNRSGWGIVNRGVKNQRNLTVLQRTRMSAILSESLFIDRADDARLLKNRAFIDALVEAHAKALEKVLKLKRKSTNNSGSSNSGSSNSGSSSPSSNGSSNSGSSRPRKFNLPNAVYRPNRPFPRGSGVRTIQNALVSVYFFPDSSAPNRGVDGVFGPKTSDAVRRFQLMYMGSSEADGIYGPRTRAALDRIVNK